tara:strand:+ start:82 stop:570 length:489 start_codon:yes stop_codon:yes gene_type:complete
MTTKHTRVIAEDQLLEITTRTIREVVNWMDWLDRDDFEAWYTSKSTITLKRTGKVDETYLNEKWKLFSLSKASWLLSLDEKNLARVISTATKTKTTKNRFTNEILRKYCPRCGDKNPTDVEYHLEGNVPHCKSCFDKETMGLSYLDDGLDSDDITIRVGTES